MPCNSDYLEPRYAEKESKLAAELIVYALESVGVSVPEHIRTAAKSLYGDEGILDDLVVMLCKMCSDMDEVGKNMIIYNGRNPTARKLADWWDKHQAADEVRKANEPMEFWRRAYQS